MALSNIQKQSFGQAGAAYITGTNLVAGDFCAITSLDDATWFETLTWAELNISQHMTGTPATRAAIAETAVITGAANTIPKGVTIYGQITGVELGAGRVLAYNAA